MNDAYMCITGKELVLTGLCRQRTKSWIKNLSQLQTTVNADPIVDLVNFLKYVEKLLPKRTVYELHRDPKTDIAIPWMLSSKTKVFVGRLDKNQVAEWRKQVTACLEMPTFTGDGNDWIPNNLGSLEFLLKSIEYALIEKAVNHV